MMNDKKNLISRADDTSSTDESLRNHKVSQRYRWINFLKQRWPTALAISMWVLLTFGGGESEGEIVGLGEALLILPLGYLVPAKLQRRQVTWLVVIAAVGSMVVLRALDLIAPSAFFITAALIVLVWGAVDGQLRRDGAFQVQALGWVGFAALALIGLAINPDLGRYLVAAGWFFHGVWDYVHLWLDKVVSRSFAEWCGLIDILIAAELIFLL